jgi:hypothetical protein
MNLNNNDDNNNDTKNINSLLKKLNKKVIVILGVNFNPCLEKINSKQDYNYKIRNECDRFLSKISYDFIKKIECETEFKFTNKNINLKVKENINCFNEKDKVIPLFVSNRIYVCCLFNKKEIVNKYITFLTKINEFNKSFRIFDEKFMKIRNSNKEFRINIVLDNQDFFNLNINIVECLRANYKYLPKITFIKKEKS